MYLSEINENDVIIVDCVRNEMHHWERAYATASDLNALGVPFVSIVCSDHVEVKSVVSLLVLTHDGIHIFYDFSMRCNKEGHCIIESEESSVVLQKRNGVREPLSALVQLESSKVSVCASVKDVSASGAAFLVAKDSGVLPGDAFLITVTPGSSGEAIRKLQNKVVQIVRLYYTKFGCMIAGAKFM